MGFTKFLLQRDFLGHVHHINYKGKEKFNTKLGAVVSMAIYCVVLVYLVERFTSFSAMSDPNITQYTRPLYESEVEDYDLINLDEYRFNLGIYFFTRVGEEKVPLSIPESVGRIVSSS